MAFGEWEQTILGEVNETRPVHFPVLVLFNQLFEVDGFVSHVGGATLVFSETKGVAALGHVGRAQAETEDVKLAGFAGTRAVALAVDQLLVVVARVRHLQAGSDAHAVVVNRARGASGRAHVALSRFEVGRARGEPLRLALLAALALLELPVSAPQRQRLLAADVDLLEELGAAEVAVQSLFQLEFVCGGLTLGNGRLRVVGGNGS